MVKNGKHRVSVRGDFLNACVFSGAHRNWVERWCGGGGVCIPII